jgi:hypothetical protein
MEELSMITDVEISTYNQKKYEKKPHDPYKSSYHSHNWFQK